MARRPNDPQRRERILQATLDTIAAHGVRAVTHRKIATCANVPLGSLTYYFSGIEALIEGGVQPVYSPRCRRTTSKASSG